MYFVTWKKPYSSEASKTCFVVSPRSCPPKSITGIALCKELTTLPGLFSGNCTKDGGTEEWTLYQLDTSIWSKVSICLVKSLEFELFFWTKKWWVPPSSPLFLLLTCICGIQRCDPCNSILFLFPVNFL